MRRIVTAAAAGLLLSTSVAHAQGNYGSVVAAAEGVVFVAQPRNVAQPGVVFIYGGAGGTWTQQARLNAPQPAAADGFGLSLAGSASRLLVGQPAAGSDAGAVWVYERRGNAWEPAGQLPLDASAGDSAGMAVAMDGDVAVVGAPGNGGRVHVFRRGANGRWAREASLRGSDTQAGDLFGAAVAVSGDRVVIGAPGQASRRGGGYVFDRANGQWSETATTVSRTVSENDGLGMQVAIMNGRAVLAAPNRDGGTGAIYVFEPNPQGSGWAAFTRLLPFDGSVQSGFGITLQVAGNELWVGSPGTDGLGALFRYQYDPARNDWTASSKLLHVSDQPVGGFGSAAAMAGDVLVAGLPFDGPGSATVYAVSGWRPVARFAGEADEFPAMTGRAVDCTNGRAGGFQCTSNVQLQSFLPISDIGGGAGVNLNDIWGWEDPETGREYALVGRTNGTSFVDVTDATNPKYLGDLPMPDSARAAAWRDIKVYRNHAYIVADGSGPHGMQVFDLTRLRGVTAPQTFTADYRYDRIASAHNIVINEESGTAYAVGVNGGGEVCGGGLHMIDIREPKSPRFVGCFSDPQTGNAGTGYSHDAQCVNYTGPDQRYRGREICFGSNETALSIADVTDRQNPVALSRAAYPNVQYAHQGWLTEDQRYFYMNDEGDEGAGVVERTRTIIWDVTDLQDPQVVGEYLGETAAIDHNLYVKGDTMYQSNYSSGLRIIDISDRSNPREIGYFDTVPAHTNTSFDGSWSNYPYFRSGNIIFTSIGEGLFVVRMQRPIS